ncbi:MAG: hypothetical protein AAB320_01950, partial [Elusimicrobiota bacterium]
MKNKMTTSRLKIALALTALCASSWAAAAETSLSEAFISLQATVQAGRARLDQAAESSKPADMDEDDVVVTPGIGHWVMDKEDRVGQIIEIYPNGAARYQVGSDVYISNYLSLEQEHGDGVWTGDTVIDTDNEIGTVMRIFCTRNPRALRDPACRIQYKVR